MHDGVPTTSGDREILPARCGLFPDGEPATPCARKENQVRLDPPPAFSVSFPLGLGFGRGLCFLFFFYSLSIQSAFSSVFFSISTLLAMNHLALDTRINAAANPTDIETLTRSKGAQLATGEPATDHTPTGIYAIAVPGQSWWRPEGHRVHRPSTPLSLSLSTALDSVLAVDSMLNNDIAGGSGSSAPPSAGW